MRPIDADALKATMIETLEQIKANPKMDGQEMHIIAGIAMLGEMIAAAPTIDAVPVVRCRECYYWESGENPCEKWEYCNFHRIGIGPHDFCSYGERKEDSNETD